MSITAKRSSAKRAQAKPQRTGMSAAESEELRKTLSDLVQLSLSGLPLEEKLQLVLRRFFSISWLALQSKGAIFLVNSEPDVLEIRAQVGLAEPLQNMCKRVPFGRCLCGRAAASKKVQFASCVDSCHENSYEGMKPHGHYCVPIILHDRVMGVLTFYIEEGHIRREKDVEFLRSVASLLAGIVEHARAEALLRESAERHRALVENIALGINQISADHRILMTNAATSKFFNKPSSDLIGKLCYEEFEKRNAVCPHCPGSVAMKTGRPAEVMTTGVLDDGTSRLCRVQAFPTFGPDGAPSGFIELVEDITEQQNAQMQAVEISVKLQNMMNGTIKAISSALELRDPYTAGHERRVAQLAGAIAGFLGLSAQQTEGIRVAGFLHDIGKIAVPAEILSRPGKLSQYEMGIIKTHPQFGYDILKEIDFLWPVALATLQHHERLNGSGYPLGVDAGGDQIILEARIIAVADVVEAMSSHRPYRPALGIEAALTEVAAKRGALYDPAVVDACTCLFKERGFRFE